MSVLYGISTWILLALLVPVPGGGGEDHSPGGVRYESNSPTAIDVVIVAHQDDWQLFMGDIVARQIQTGRQVVFIYLTAGDYGRDSLYWTTRERGALESTRVVLGLTTTDSAADPCSMAKPLEHPIRKCTIANTDSYFLRLPDGRRGGAGFALHSFESLRKLRAKRMADLRRNTKWNVEYYAGYALATRAANRSQDQARQKHALFVAYDRVMTKANPMWSAYRERPRFYSDCMVRTYARSVLSR